MPYTKTPGEIIPGVAEYYASTFQEGLAVHSVLVKTREGRPIHIEGNPENPFSNGKTSLRAMGDLLGLYDPDRLRAPVHKEKPSTWDDAEKALIRALSDARLHDKPVLLMTGAIVSPTQRALIEDLKLALPALHHAAWEPVAEQSEISAVAALFGKAIVPGLHLDRADVIVSLQSDFLGADPNAAMYIRDFAARRAISRPADAMNRLWVCEGGMTLTGSNADQRMQVRPSKTAAMAFALARLLNESHGLPLPPGLKPEELEPFAPEFFSARLGVELSMLRLLAEDLSRARSSALVLAGSALPPEAHVACHTLNIMLGAEWNTVDLDSALSSPELLSSADLKNIFADAARGKFAVGIFWDANPAYAFPDLSLWKAAIGKISETFRIGLYEDETALDCAWRLPEHHWLESWGDFESAVDFVSLRQPAIGAIHDTRQAEDFLLACMRKMKIQDSRNYFEYLKFRWLLSVYPQGSPVWFETFWNAALHDGGAKYEIEGRAPLALNVDAIRRALNDSIKSSSEALPGEMELNLHR